MVMTTSEMATRKSMTRPSLGASGPNGTTTIASARGAHRPCSSDPKQERSSCFYCLEGWIFLDCLHHDGEEIS